MSTLIIGAGYAARQGKDSFCQQIREAYGDRYRIVQYAFANELKKEVENIGASYLAFKFGIPLDPNPPMDDPLCPKGKQSRVLQFWGEHVRKESPFHWVDKVKNAIDRDRPQIALISDMRHMNEAAFVKGRGGYTVKVTRQGYVDLSRDPNHPSETALQNYTFDFDINVAEGALDELKADALYVFEEIVKLWNPDPVVDLAVAA